VKTAAEAGCRPVTAVLQPVFPSVTPCPSLTLQLKIIVITAYCSLKNRQVALHFVF
jgi:hypothetical protein